MNNSCELMVSHMNIQLNSLDPKSSERVYAYLFGQG